MQSNLEKEEKRPGNVFKGLMRSYVKTHPPFSFYCGNEVKDPWLLSILSDLTSRFHFMGKYVRSNEQQFTQTGLQYEITMAN